MGLGAHHPRAMRPQPIVSQAATLCAHRPKTMRPMPTPAAVYANRGFCATKEAIAQQHTWLGLGLGLGLGFWVWVWVWGWG